MRVPTFAALLLPLGDVQAATTSSSVSSASSYVPWSLADNKTSLTIIESQLTMCTYSKVEECIQDPKLVSELGALYRAPGYCIAMDSAYVKPPHNAAIPTDTTRLRSGLPLLYNETIALGEDMLCCTESQYTGLSTQVRMIPSRATPNSMFLDINEVRIMSGDDEHEGQIFPAVEEATYYVGKDWIRDIYDFCEDDSSFSLLCNPNQDCTDGYGLMEYMGKYAYNSIGSPEQINVTTMDKFSEEIQMTEFCHCDDANETNCSDSDSTWAELNEYLATNIPETDWAPLNYFLVIFGGVVGILIIVGFIVAILRERRYNAVDRRSGTPQVIGPDTPDFHDVASAMAGSTGYLSFLDDFMTKKLRLWAAFVSKGNRPKKIIPMVLVVVVVCAVGLYNIDIETDPIKLVGVHIQADYSSAKDGGSIYRSSILKEAIRVQNVAANVTYTSDDGETPVALDEFAEGYGYRLHCHSITQYFQNNMEHFEFYEKYGARWSTSATNALDNDDSHSSTMSDCPCLSTFGSPMNLYTRTLQLHAVPGLDRVCFFVPEYNYADDDKNEPAIKWEREYIKTMKKEVEANTVFDVYFYAEISVQDEVDAESSNGMGPVALSYCLMLIYISLFSREFFISSKIVAGFCGVISIACGVASTVGLYMWFGVKLQLIIMEVVPFLSLAIGVDNIFLLIHAMTEKEDQLRHDQPSDRGDHDDIVSESLAYIGPSIFMASAAESVAFAFGSISAMPVVLWFAAMACCAVAINFCFQMTFFLSVLTLDKRRELSGKYDIIFKRASSVTAQVETIQQSSEPLVSLEPKTPAADDKHSLTQVLDYCVDVYASILTHKLVKMIVLLAFLAWTLWSIYSMETLDQGLPQKEAMPSTLVYD
ncbi:Niemann-Pick C type protein [Phytophthora cactorum]|nr:Niemann-Pick C type protein [Phytophthora cactorum]